MIDFNMPIFDVKATTETIVVAGGGGNKDYGVENGVIILLKEDWDKRCFYKTDDIITSVEVFDCEHQDEFILDEDQIEEIESDESIPEIADSEDSIEEMKNSESDDKNLEKSIEEDVNAVLKKELIEDNRDDINKDIIKKDDIIKKNNKNDNKDIIKKDDNKEELSTKKRNNKTVDEKLVEELKEKHKDEIKSDFPEVDKILIAAVGQKFIHLLKFDGELTVISKIEKSVKKAILSNHLLFLADHNIYGFYDIENNKNFSIRPTEISHSLEKNDNNIFDLVKQNNRIICKDSKNSNWDNFFVSEGKIYKVCYNENKSTFNFDNCDAEIDAKISKIICKSKILVFYSIHKKGSILNINGVDNKLERITALSVDKNIVAVSTASGNIIIFENGKNINEMNVSDLPITGVSLGNDQIYFTILNGVVGSKKIHKKSFFTIFMILVFILMIIGALIDFFYGNKGDQSHRNW